MTPPFEFCVTNIVQVLKLEAFCVIGNFKKTVILFIGVQNSCESEVICISCAFIEFILENLLFNLAPNSNAGVWRIMDPKSKDVQIL